jgi:hypothetical protein
MIRVIQPLFENAASQSELWLIPELAPTFEFRLAATSPNRASSSPFPLGEGLPRSARKASIELCLAESKFKVWGRFWYILPSSPVYEN